MKDKKPVNITAWVDKLDHCIVLCLSDNGLRTTLYMTPERAQFLIAELEQAIDAVPAVPAVLTAADLGIEGAPV